MKTTRTFCDLCGSEMVNNLGTKLSIVTTATLPTWTESKWAPEDVCADCGKALHDKLVDLKKPNK